VAQNCDALLAASGASLSQRQSTAQHSTAQHSAPLQQQLQCAQEHFKYTNKGPWSTMQPAAVGQATRGGHSTI
jgi:hypothetical protein